MVPLGRGPAAQAPGLRARLARIAGRVRHAPRSVLLVWVALLAVTVLATVALLRPAAAPPPLTRQEATRAAEAVVKGQAERDRAGPTEAGLAYRAVRPALVVIQTASRPAAGSRGRAGGRAPGPGATETSLGTGVIMNAAGSILTALHVVEGAGTITVTFADGTSCPATVTRTQPADDIAVLTASRLPPVITPAVLAGGGGVGDRVYAVGHPLGLSASLTAGVISATGRSVEVAGGGTLRSLIQFDAAVNPGSSGGPLLNRDGQVIGVVTALANPTKQAFFVGVGFAVPIATAAGVGGAPPL